MSKNLIIILIFIFNANSVFGNVKPTITRLTVNGSSSAYKNIFSELAVRDMFQAKLTKMLHSLYPHLDELFSVDLLLLRSADGEKIYMSFSCLATEGDIPRTNAAYIVMMENEMGFLDVSEIADQNKRIPDGASQMNFSDYSSSSTLNRIRSVAVHQMLDHLFFPAMKKGWVMDEEGLKISLGISERSELSQWQVVNLLAKAVDSGIITGTSEAYSLANVSPRCENKTQNLVEQLHDTFTVYGIRPRTTVPPPRISYIPGVPREGSAFFQWVNGKVTQVK